MFKKLLLVVFFVGAGSQFCGAMEKSEECDKSTKECRITMPGSEELNEFFYDRDLSYFAEKVGLLELLAGKKMTPREIELAKCEALCVYRQRLQEDYKQPVMIEGALRSVSRAFDALIDEIVRDFPEAKKQIQACRVEVEEIKKIKKQFDSQDKEEDGGSDE